MKCILYSAFTLLFFLTVSNSVNSQVSGKLPLAGKKNIITGVYKFVTLESFETNSFLSRLSDISDKEFCSLSSSLPAPEIGSSQYLVIKLSNGEKSSLMLDFRDKYVMTGFVRSVRLWVYSPYLPGRMRLIVEDSMGNDYTLQSQKLVFRGWKQIIFRTDTLISQNDFYIGQFRPLFLKRILYFPGPRKRLQREQLLFIDEISYETRPKYLLPKAK